MNDDTAARVTEAMGFLVEAVEDIPRRRIGTGHQISRAGESRSWWLTSPAARQNS